MIRRSLSRTIVFLSLMTCAALCAAPDALAQDWNQGAAAVTGRAAEAKAEARQTTALVADERKELRSEIASLKQQAKDAEAELERLKSLFATQLDQEQVLRKELEEGKEDIEALSGTLRATAKEADSLIAENAVTPEYPGRRDVIRTILDEDRFPGFADIQSLAEIFFQEMDATGRVVVRRGDFIGPDGSMAQGEILRAGRFLSAYRADGKLGFLRPNAQGDRLVSVTGEPSASAKADIAAWMDKGAGGSSVESQAAPLPVDLSHGAVFASLGTNNDVMDWLESGGILVWPILAVGVLALLLALERLVVLGRFRAHSGKRMQTLREMAMRGEWEKGKDFCRSNARFPGCRVVGEILDYGGASREILENALEEAIMRELPRLERFLPTLGVLAAIAPLLGLLGTVTGMINTFHVITLFGAGDPRMMSGGISEALITTQIGLAVAIPIMLVHHFLDRRVGRIVNDMEENGSAFALLLMQRKENGHDTGKA